MPSQRVQAFLVLHTVKSLGIVYSCQECPGSTVFKVLEDVLPERDKQVRGAAAFHASKLVLLGRDLFKQPPKDEGFVDLGGKHRAANVSQLSYFGWGSCFWDDCY